eukprot:SAG22_NODE_6515_length_844_cov_1.518121_1_plen_63_part_10
MPALDWQSERFERWTHGVTLKHLHELKEIFRAGKPPQPVRMVVLAAMAVCVGFYIDTCSWTGG